jgi:hypothetical protein
MKRLKNRSRIHKGNCPGILLIIKYVSIYIVIAVVASRLNIFELLFFYCYMFNSQFGKLKIFRRVLRYFFFIFFFFYCGWLYCSILLFKYVLSIMSVSIVSFMCKILTVSNSHCIGQVLFIH